MNIKNKIGVFGQKLAVGFLQKRGFKILNENYHARVGEIDIIAEKEGQLVFIEVKTRLSDKFGLPEEAVDDRKKARMYETALQYMGKMQINHDNFRLDCIAIMIDKENKKAIIRQHKNIF